MPHLGNKHWLSLLAVSCSGTKAVNLKSEGVSLQRSGDGPWMLHDPQSGECITAKASLLSESEAVVARQAPVYNHLEGDGACGIEGNLFHQRCHCIGRSLSFCKDICDEYTTCVGYVGRSDGHCQYATTSASCEEGCGLHNEGNIGPIKTVGGAKYLGCYVKEQAGSDGPQKLPKDLQIGGGGECLKFFGFDVRGSRVLFRLRGQEEKKVLHYDADNEKWIIADEVPDHFEKKQLFDAGKEGGHWCLVYDSNMCFRLTAASTTTSTTTTTPPTTTTGPTTTTTTTTTTTSTTTTSTTVTYAPPRWVKGKMGENCLVVCGQTEGGMCLEDRWPGSEDEFRNVLRWVGDLSKCSSIEKGDWDTFPALYDGEICYWRENNRDPARCNHRHYAVERYCPCQGPQWTTAAPKPDKPSPPRNTPTTRRRSGPKRRRRNKATGSTRRRRGKGGKGGRRRRRKLPTAAP